VVIETPDTDTSVTDAAPRVVPVSRMPSWAAPAVAAVVTLMALAPVITIVVQRAGRTYWPLQDEAVNDLRLRDVLSFSHNTPLVGVWSGYGGFNHPGPSMFYLSAPFAWLFGNAAWATLVAYALLQGVAIAWTARLAWKTGGLPWTVVWMAIMALSYQAVTPHPWVLQRAWNPYVAFPFFVLFLLQCLVVARGDRRRLLGLVFVGSFLVQTHIGYAILVLALGGWAVIHLAVQLRRQHYRISRSDWLWPAVVLVVMWFPPLVLDPIFDSPNNIQRLAHYFTSRDLPPALGLSAALGYLAREFRWVPPWLGGPDRVKTFTLGDPVPSSAGLLVVPAALVVATGWWSRRERSREVRLVAELLAITLVGSVLSLASMRAEPQSFRFLWTTVAATATVVLTLTVAVEAIGRRWKVAGWAWSVALVTVVAVGSGSFASQVAAASGPVRSVEPIEASLVAQLNGNGQPDGPALVRLWGDQPFGMENGLIDQLAREHRPVFVDPTFGFEFGYGRTATPDDVSEILVVVEDSGLYIMLSNTPGARVVAVSHPLPDAQQTELFNLERRVDRALARDGVAGEGEWLGDPFLVTTRLANVRGVTLQERQRLVQLDAAVAAHGCLCAVVEFPPTDSTIGNRPPPTY
jgi:hypothetical protein